MNTVVPQKEKYIPKFIKRKNEAIKVTAIETAKAELRSIGTKEWANMAFQVVQGNKEPLLDHVGNVIAPTVDTAIEKYYPVMLIGGGILFVLGIGLGYYITK